MFAIGKMSRLVYVLFGLVAGLGLIALSMLNRQLPAHGEIEPVIPTLSTVTVSPTHFMLEARGYGVTRAAASWQAVANVPGRVIKKHPDLESGALLRKGTLLLEQDPARYKLAIADSEAELASLAAELEKLETERENTRRLLTLERSRLKLAEQELARMERLTENGSVSRSRRDEQQRTTIAQRQAVATLENQIALIPSRLDYLIAQQDRAQTRLAQARQDLADTRFIAPYDMRIDRVEIDLHQHAVTGQRLFRADSIAAAEIETHIPLPMVQRLMGSLLGTTADDSALEISSSLDLGAIRAEVRLAGSDAVRWPARVSRVASGLDPETRTARVIVTVDAPYDRVGPAQRPLMQPGMYVQVYLTARSHKQFHVLPASAVHEGEVYRVTEQDRLERQPVDVEFEQNDLAIIRRGLADGDRVIIDDPVPAISGMQIAPRQNLALERDIRARALGDLL